MKSTQLDIRKTDRE